MAAALKGTLEAALPGIAGQTPGRGLLPGPHQSLIGASELET